MTSKKLINLFESGIKANLEDSYRRFNLIELPKEGDVIVAGDIHGHRRNFERVLSYADLANNPKRHLVLQEIIHGGPEDEQGGCLSFELLFEAVKLKIEFKDQVHLIMANHDTAFINNSEVMKNGKEMNVSMRKALERKFADDMDAVESVIERFLFSQPLAVKCANRIWFSHSLPADRYLKKFDFTIFNRQTKISDLVRPNSVYTLTWGRRQSREALDSIAEKLDVDLFVLGHQVQDSGWMTNGKNLVIIDSQHSQGYLCHIDLTRSYAIDGIVESLVKLAQIP